MRNFLTAAIALSLAACAQVASVTDETTLAEFEQVETGMTLEQVEGVLGEGEEVSRIAVAGAPETVIYAWKNPTGSNATISIQNGVVITKAQTGLK